MSDLIRTILEATDKGYRVLFEAGENGMTPVMRVVGFTPNDFHLQASRALFEDEQFDADRYFATKLRKRVLG